MRTFLYEAGFIRAEDLHKTDDSILIPVDDRLSQFLADLKSAMTFSDACAYIGATRRQMELLVEGGLVKAITADMKAHNKYSFAQRELDRFLAALLKRAVRARPWEEGLVSIAAAAERTCCRSVDVVALILEGRLPTVRHPWDVDGYRSILVKLSEVKAAKGEMAIRRVAGIKSPDREP